MNHFQPGRNRARTRTGQRGQGLVEFSLTFPLFFTMLVAILEFGFAFNSWIGLNYATRNAALLAAEAGNGSGGDCVILAEIEKDVVPPADQRNIQQVQIAWTDVNGNIQNGGAAVNTYTRTGSTTCTLPDGTRLTVPYTIQGAAGYPEASRCNVIAGCGGGHPGLDTIGVQVTYLHTWRTPFPGLLRFGGAGWTLVQSNQMRMEPIL